MDAVTVEIVALASQLIERPSVTPDDAGCQSILQAELRQQGFEIETLPFGEVDNFWATHGSGSPMLVFAGHTDVVPSGPEEDWRFDPFLATQFEGMLFGRGSADMKGSLAAMVTATRRYLQDRSDHTGTIAYLITSDEEGSAVDGTTRVVTWLAERGIKPEYCVVGEPSSTAVVGDVIRIGRRGSLNGTLTVRGVQGHVAYPAQANNPIHAALAALQALTEVRWDEGNEAFPATSLQISNIQAGTGASNVIPGELQVQFNLRFSTEQTSHGLKKQIERLLDPHGFDYELDWAVSGEPFLTATETLLGAVSASVRAEQSFDPQRSTGGGTSDGRFIAELGTEIVELGPINATIHSVDECTAIADLGKLCNMYRGILHRLLDTSR
jgi:succinyl-diaminopimelate desuccinylase